MEVHMKTIRQIAVLAILLLSSSTSLAQDAMTMILPIIGIKII